MESKRHSSYDSISDCVDNQFTFGSRTTPLAQTSGLPGVRRVDARPTASDRGPGIRTVSRPGALAVRWPAAGSWFITGPSRLNGSHRSNWHAVERSERDSNQVGAADWVPAWTEMPEQLTLRSARSPSGCNRSTTQSESRRTAQLRLYRRVKRSWPTLMRANAITSSPSGDDPVHRALGRPFVSARDRRPRTLHPRDSTYSGSRPIATSQHAMQGRLRSGFTSLRSSVSGLMVPTAADVLSQRARPERRAPAGRTGRHRARRLTARQGRRTCARLLPYRHDF